MLVLVVLARRTTSVLNHGWSRQRGTSEAWEFNFEQACSQLLAYAVSAV